MMMDVNKLDKIYRDMCHEDGVFVPPSEAERYGDRLGPSCLFPRRRQIGGEERWFVARTEPRREKTVLAFLVARGISWIWPTELVRQKAGRAAQWRAVGLFPSIVFVRLGLHTYNWRGDQVLSTPGVLGFMQIGSELATVDDVAIEQLRFHMVSGLDTREEIPTGKKGRVIPFKAGDNGRFKEGPFGGLVATITAVDPKGRISLLLDLFGRSTKIEVDADEIAAA